MEAYRIAAQGIVKKYIRGSGEIQILKGVDFFARKNEFISVMGPSGSGKSTLMHILGCLDRPTQGSYEIDGVNVLKASDNELSHFRANQIGFVFQKFHLLPELNVFENVELPFLYAASNNGNVTERIMTAVEQVGLGDRITHKPTELSGGEMQRVAIARALAIEPKIVLADEPTGNLDSKTGEEILSLFHNLHKVGATIIMVTHNREVASYAQRTMVLIDGKFVEYTA